MLGRKRGNEREKRRKIGWEREGRMQGRIRERERWGNEEKAI